MDKKLLCAIIGGLLVLVGVAAASFPNRLRYLGLRYYLPRDRVEKFIPFGRWWMLTNEKEHIFSIRISGLGAIAMGAAVLYIALTRL